MPKIQLLADKVINKIAAGEVVERPASIVKELVENALDAGSTNIIVQLEDGGKRRITVIDNGSGLLREDVPLAVARHATSKIRTEDDLFQIHSMGFRGEALASIAAVSHFTLRTQPRDGGGGSTLLVAGGDVQDVIDWQGQGGTSVTVSDLFFNIPARRSFLKSTAAEFAACFEQMNNFALARPDVAFSLEHNGKNHMSCQALNAADWQSSVRMRAVELIGQDISDELVFVSGSSKVLSMNALISPPGRSFPHAKHIHIFLNGRCIKDKTVRFGLLRGYHSHLLRGKYPCAILDLKCDPSLIDVNVHPAKTDVRFQYSSDVQSLIAVTVRNGLRAGDWASPIVEPTFQPSLPAEHQQPFRPAVSRSSSFQSARTMQSDFSSESLGYKNEASFRAAPRVLMSYSEQPSMARDVAAPIEARDQNIPWGELQFIGAFAKCYLMFEHQERLLIIDQHAFHERVMYERLKLRLAETCTSQPLMLPETLDFPASYIAALRTHSEEIKRVGFSFDIVDETHLELHAVPQLLMKRDIENALSELAELLVQSSASASEALFHDILSTLACHSAVRAGEELGAAELAVLLSEAGTVDFYHNCPHGRPVFRWWKKSQVAGWFDR